MIDDVRHIEQLLTEKIAGRRVLVVGDLMLDRYLWGIVERISPEAPIPVVKLTGQSDSPGGAANVARNLAGLGVEVTVAGECGTDQAGDRLIALLGERGINTGPVCRYRKIPTTVKTRVVVKHNQLLRLDEEGGGVVAAGEESVMSAALERALNEGPEAVVISDYAKGAVTAAVVGQLVAFCRKHGIPLFVDPKGSRYEKYRGATCITPNYREFCEAVGGEPDSEAALLSKAGELRESLGLDSVVITRGGEGITHVGRQQLTVPATAREVFDVSGAGDTVVAMLAVAHIAGLDIEHSLQLANLAAGVVIGKVGTVAINGADLVVAVYQTRSFDSSQKQCGAVELLEKVELWRRGGLRIGLARGHFDPLGASFVEDMERARGKCGRLVVLFEGDGEPAEGDRLRVRLIAALNCIDVVTCVTSAEADTLIGKINPDILL